MKILLSAGNYSGSNIMLSRWLKHLKGHDIRTFAYYHNSQFLNSVDYILDPLFNDVENCAFDSFGIKGPRVNKKIADLIITDISEWCPDLIISDCEKISALLAKLLDIPLWYCSFILQGVGWDNYRINNQIQNYIFYTLPKAERYFIYSPLCDVENRPVLKKGFEWVRPYSDDPEFLNISEDLSLVQKVIKDELITTGETSFVSDCIYSEWPFFIYPDPNNIEQIINARNCDNLKIATNLGRQSNLSLLKKSVEKIYQPKLKLQNNKTLDEIINGKENSF